MSFVVIYLSMLPRPGLSVPYVFLLIIHNKSLRI